MLGTVRPVDGLRIGHIHEQRWHSVPIDTLADISGNIITNSRLI